MINFLPDAGSKTIGADQPFLTSARQVTSDAGSMGAPVPTGDESAEVKPFSSIFHSIEGQTAKTEGREASLSRAEPINLLPTQTDSSLVSDQPDQLLSFTSKTSQPISDQAGAIAEFLPTGQDVGPSGPIILQALIAGDDLSLSDSLIQDDLSPRSDTNAISLPGTPDSLPAPETVTGPYDMTTRKETILPIQHIGPELVVHTDERPLQVSDGTSVEMISVERPSAETIPEAGVAVADDPSVPPISETVKIDADLRVLVGTRPITGEAKFNPSGGRAAETATSQVQTEVQAQAPAQSLAPAPAQSELKPAKLMPLENRVPLAANDGSFDLSSRMPTVEPRSLASETAPDLRAPVPPLDGERASLAPSLFRDDAKTVLPAAHALPASSSDATGQAVPSTARAEIPARGLTLNDAVPEKQATPHPATSTSLASLLTPPADPAALSSNAGTTALPATPVQTSIQTPAPVMTTPLSPMVNTPIAPFILPTVPVATLTQLPQTIVATTLSKQRAMIQIDPPELGRIQIDYAFESGQRTRVMLVPETEAARVAMTDRLPSLVALFETHHNGAVDVEIQSSDRFDSEFKQDSLFSQSDNGGAQDENKTNQTEQFGPISDQSARTLSGLSADSLPKLDGRNGNRLHLRI